MTDSDLRAVRQNIEQLTENQLKLKHVVGESLTLINLNRVKIVENRQTINEIIGSLTEMDNRLTTLQQVEKDIYKIEPFLSVYFQIDVAMEELKQAMQRMTVYIQQLQLQLNSLSIGRLAPSTITPEKLRELLLDVKGHLAPNHRLPGDPSTDLWRFYQILTCSTVLERSRLLVFVSIPLLNVDELELYEVHNLPLPPPFMRSQVTTSTTMTARYELEAYALAVDIKRTTVALLDRVEFEIVQNHC